MNLIFRLIKILIKALFGKSSKPLAEAVIDLWVWPQDLDPNFHMNNGRYLTIMDLGRIDLMIRTSLAKVMMKYRLKPMVGSEMIRFRRSLSLFESYQLHTRMIGWDEKWFYIEHRFMKKGELIAIAFIKGVLINKKNPLTPSQIMAEIDKNIRSPEIPEGIYAWAKAEQQLSSQIS